jgi:hypothetical protein
MFRGSVLPGTLRHSLFPTMLKESIYGLPVTEDEFWSRRSKQEIVEGLSCGYGTKRLVKMPLI